MDIITGDDNYIKVTLTKSGSTFNIGQGSVIKASIIDKNHQKILAGPITMSRLEAGADWANSLVVIRIPAKSMLLTQSSSQAILEIKVNDANVKSTWFSNVNVVRGTIE